MRKPTSPNPNYHLLLPLFNDSNSSGWSGISLWF
jgi:hypothetical protein